MYFFSNDISDKFRIWDCLELNKAIYAEELVFNAINLNHQIADNKDKKEEFFQLQSS